MPCEAGLRFSVRKHNFVGITGTRQLEFLLAYTLVSEVAGLRSAGLSGKSFVSFGFG